MFYLVHIQKVPEVFKANSNVNNKSDLNVRTSEEPGYWSNRYDSDDNGWASGGYPDVFSNRSNQDKNIEAENHVRGKEMIDKKDEDVYVLHVSYKPKNLGNEKINDYLNKLKNIEESDAPPTSMIHLEPQNSPDVSQPHSGHGDLFLWDDSSAQNVIVSSPFSSSLPPVSFSSPEPVCVALHLNSFFPHVEDNTSKSMFIDRHVVHIYVSIYITFYFFILYFFHH
jgi:hypothetical protein